MLGSLCFDLQYFVSFLVLHHLAVEFSILPAAGHNEQIEAFFLLKDEDTSSKTCVFFYSVRVVFFSSTKDRPVHQTEPAALGGDKVVVVIKNFVQSSC